MTRAEQLAKNLRQIVVVFWLFGILGTLGYIVMIVDAFDVREDQFVSTGAVLGLVAQLLVLWIGLAWMGLVANGLAELLTPTASERPPGAS